MDGAIMYAMMEGEEKCVKSREDFLCKKKVEIAVVLFEFSSKRRRHNEVPYG